MSDPMAAFRQRFVERCREELQVVRSGDDAQLRAAAHRIAGLAGTVGFPELSLLAGRVDDQLSGGGTANAADREALAAAMAALAREV